MKFYDFDRDRVGNFGLVVFLFFVVCFVMGDIEFYGMWCVRGGWSCGYSKLGVGNDLEYLG